MPTACCHSSSLWRLVLLLLLACLLAGLAACSAATPAATPTPPVSPTVGGAGGQSAATATVTPTPRPQAPAIEPARSLARNCEQRSFAARPMTAGQIVIDFTLKDVKGKEYTLSSLLAEKPVIMIFGSFT